MDFIVLVYTILKIVFILFDVVILIGFFYALKEGWKYRPHFHPHTDHGHSHGTAPVNTVQKERVTKRWREIMKKFEASTTNDSRKIAIIEADKMIDTLLKDAGFEGQHMADRLQQLSPEKVSTLDRLWRAHRLRNQIVHSADFEVSATLAERTMDDYEAFLKEAQMLEE